MKNLNKTMLAALQIIAVFGNDSSAMENTRGETLKTKNEQEVFNKISLKAIEESWLRVPRVCKAAAFNAQPVSLQKESRSEISMNLYSSQLSQR